MEGALGRHRTSPTGLVRVGLSTAGATLLAPRLFTLLEKYPGLAVELVVRDRLGDMVEDRLDVAMQVGQPGDSSLMAAGGGAFGPALVASPIYLERHGSPSRPAELTGHTCVIHEVRSATARCGISRGPRAGRRSASTAHSAPTTPRSCTGQCWPGTGSPWCPRR